jgi:hypothetical protein
LRRLRRFGAAAAFFAFFRAAMIHPLVDESVRRGRSRTRTLSPFVRFVKSMFRRRVVRRVDRWGRSLVVRWGPSPTEPTEGVS